MSSAPHPALPAARRCFRLFRRFQRNAEGVTAVEFGIVAVPFFGLLAAIFESSLVFFAAQGMSAAVEQASRTILTGQAQSNTSITTAQQFRDAMICSPSSPMSRVLPTFVDCSKVIVDVRPASSFAAADVANDFYSGVTGEYCTGGPGDIIVVRAVYPMPVYFSIVEATNSGIGPNRSGQTLYNGSWTHMVMGISAFRNEPFTNYSGTAPGC
jgi:Flp pilus assembly protein TadG